MSGYRRDPYASAGGASGGGAGGGSGGGGGVGNFAYDDPYASRQQPADPYARPRDNSRSNPYAKDLVGRTNRYPDPYASSSNPDYQQKRYREYEYGRPENKRGRYDEAAQQPDPYRRNSQGSSRYADPYATGRRDDYGAQPAYSQDRRDDRYAQDSYARQGRDDYARGGFDNRRGGYGAGQDYPRRDYDRRGGYDDRGGYGRSGYDDRGYSSRGGYGGADRGGGYAAERGGGYDGRGGGGGGGYDRPAYPERRDSGGYGGGRGGGGYGGGRGGNGFRGRGRGGRGGGRDRRRGPGGGRTPQEPEKEIPFVLNFADTEGDIAEIGNFNEPTGDKRVEGPQFDGQGAGELFEPEVEDGPQDGKDISKEGYDADEDACTVVVENFPKDMQISQLKKFFKNIAMLRDDPKKLDDGKIAVTFRKQKDVPFTIEWFKNPEKAKIEQTVLQVQAMKAA